MNQSRLAKISLALLLACIALGTSAQYVGHIIPHSHDDVGWLLTINGYYETFVKSIYDTVIEALDANPSRKFIAVEMAYFSMWWEQADLFQRLTTYKLVDNGQLEFIVGGWTMEDEACTTYGANIDQMTEGHQFIVSLFGEKAAPRYGWQIDPFGHSNVVHEQFGLMGFEATVLDRIQAGLKGELCSNKTTEFIWQTSESLGESSEIFTHVMPFGMYVTPVSGLEWDAGSIPVSDLNIKQLSDSIVKEVIGRASNLRTKNVMFTWGNDFEHFFAVKEYDNMDKLIDYINKNSDTYNVTVRYSTLSDYFDAVASENVTWSLFPPEDFFPYYDSTGDWWTGYYTSRVALKGFIRSRENVLRVAELLHVLSSTPFGLRNNATDLTQLTALRRANGEGTHHDAVTGTSEPFVVKMYDDHLTAGTEAVEPLIENAASLLGQTSSSAPQLSLDAALIQSLQHNSEASVSVVVFNPTSWTLNQFVSVPCFQTNLIVTDDQGNTVAFDVFASNATASGDCQAPGTCGHVEIASPYVLHFEVSVAALGYQTYFVSVNTTQSPTEVTYTVSTTATSVFNGVIELQFDASTHLLTSMTNTGNDLTVDVAQNFYEYDSIGQVKSDIGPEGAYVFHPKGPANPVVSSPYFFEVIQGRFVSEVRQHFTLPCNDSFGQVPPTQSCGVQQVYRIFQSAATTLSSYVEVVTSVGPLMNNKDFISLYNTSLVTSKFATDDNCFDVHERQFDPSQASPIAGNYYPLTCAGFIYDENNDAQLTVLVDRTHGATSQTSGQFEIMYHRRILNTDWHGPLNLEDRDNIQNMRSFLILGNQMTSTRLRKQLQYTLNFPPTLLFAAGTGGASSWTAVSNYSALFTQMPPNVHILSLLHLNSSMTSVLLRLVHVYEINDDPVLSNPVTVALSSYIKFGTIVSMEERTLSVAHPVSYLEKIGKKVSVGTVDPTPANGWSVSLNPTQIRTFLVDFSAPL